MGYEGFLTFNAIDHAGDIKVPTAIIHGTHDMFCTPENARQFYDRLTTVKEFFWIDTSNHIDLYDQDRYVDQAVEEAAHWFNRYLLSVPAPLRPRVTVAV
jgi:fermentation-respiration switch protein FrsA (DUF1100 family)